MVMRLPLVCKRIPPAFRLVQPGPGRRQEIGRGVSLCCNRSGTGMACMRGLEGCRGGRRTSHSDLTSGHGGSRLGFTDPRAALGRGLRHQVADRCQLVSGSPRAEPGADPCGRPGARPPRSSISAAAPHRLLSELAREGYGDLTGLDASAVAVTNAKARYGTSPAASTGSSPTSPSGRRADVARVARPRGVSLPDRGGSAGRLYRRHERRARARRHRDHCAHSPWMARTSAAACPCNATAAPPWPNGWGRAFRLRSETPERHTTPKRRRPALHLLRL